MSTIENNQELFTAHAIAAALNISRQHVFKVLKTVPPSGQVLKAGRPVNAWTFLALPADFRDFDFIAHPESRIPDPVFQIPHPESRIPDPAP